ncbi:MAG: DUF4080 domain-containing protein [Candidatus Hydrogenedentes bacterium]|nr:DUF4080 domain-containing protein [Candidatus Hydrogenedentota bacterium]
MTLTTINARYTHTSFGLRYLWANLGALREQAVVREFALNQPAGEIAEALLADDPKIIGLGVYIWNVAPITQVVQIIKAVRPETVVVIGGPEVSYEYEGTELFAAADFLVRGEGDIAFAELAVKLLNGRRPAERVVSEPHPDLCRVALPYDAYTDKDLSQRITYVEASRGCPFSCEFCLSSLEDRVREFPLDAFLAAMQRLMDRGARNFTFVDRTFNLRAQRVERILRFFLDRWREGMRLHFEIMPDRLAPSVLDLLAQFPPGGLHLEVGIQTFNVEAQTAISRRQDMAKTEQNLKFLRTRTGATIHADLIVGLPGESMESFGEGFNRLIALAPQEIQVGILKRLKGTPITRHTETHELAFSPQPPYEVLQTDLIDYAQMQRLKRFARYFDLYYNSGNFPKALPLLWRSRPTAFRAILELSDYIWTATGRTHEFPLAQLAEYLYTFLIQAGSDAPDIIADTINADFHRLPGRKDRLRFLAQRMRGS